MILFHDNYLLSYEADGYSIGVDIQISGRKKENIDQFSKEYCLDLLVNLRKLKMKIRYDYKHQIKKSLKKASESKIKFAIIVGEEEIKNNNYTLKNLFDSSQKTVCFEELKNILQL